MRPRAGDQGRLQVYALPPPPERWRLGHRVGLGVMVLLSTLLVVWGGPRHLISLALWVGWTATVEQSRRPRVTSDDDGVRVGSGLWSRSVGWDHVRSVVVERDFGDKGRVLVERTDGGAPLLFPEYAVSEAEARRVVDALGAELERRRRPQPSSPLNG